MIWSPETCPEHVSLMGRDELVILKDGSAIMFGVRIKYPNECLRCGKMLTFHDHFSAATKELKRLL